MAKAKMTLLALMFLGSAFAAFADLSNVTQYGCEDTKGFWRCHIPAGLNGSHAKLTDHIACFSTTLDSFDKGCFGSLELLESVVVKDCTYSVTEDREFVYHPCEDVVLERGSTWLAVINPEQIEMSGCERFEENGIYVVDCVADGKEFAFNGMTNLWDEEGQLIVIIDMEKAGFDWASFLVNNGVYIILIIVIIVVAYLVFTPHKPMLKERKETPKQEKYVSKRESKYGRRI